MHEVKLQCRGCGAINKVLLSEKNKSYKCHQCNLVLLKDKIINGFIYLLSNENIPNLIKIGYCKRPVEERVKELSSQTGVPNSFTIEAYFGSDRPEDDERKVHEELKNYRIEKKEFFKISATEAVENITHILDSKPIYILSSKDHSAKESIKITEPEIKTPVICPQCGNTAIFDAFKNMD
jgi:predicted RNA-binding Zn-ribbon protein involved in translation (DUF1610 family)